ncbi:MAG: hypothetical protein AAFR42_00015 [Cyanobacteria bacterium J06628_6]
MYLVSTFYQMWRYRTFHWMKRPFIHRPQDEFASLDSSSDRHHRTAMEAVQKLQQSYHLERYSFF